MSGISRAVFGDTKKRADAALQNEQLTRMRVESLEQRQSKTEAVLSRDLLGRLTWLLLGR